MDKASALRLERLHAMIEGRLEQPQAALEALLTEMRAGNPHPELWEGVHAAALRDGKEAELAKAYGNVASPRRVKPLPAGYQAELLMHVADFHQGVLGDRETATTFLERVIDAVPGNQEAFERLDRGYDVPHRIALYAKVALGVPERADDLARKALDLTEQLPARTPLPDETCREMLGLAAVSSRAASVLDKHCEKTGRTPLGCELLEQVVGTQPLRPSDEAHLRHRLVEHYLAGTEPEKAIDHVERLVDLDPLAGSTRAAAEKLMGSRSVSKRAAAVVATLRKSMRPPPR